ncbi:MULTISPECIES: hypothetical protein [unclassified Pseudomonas]|jgi:hypothetical protein|uniref:hypothetical protein n=1 Tax=unclassified Pseudomonas TaxID=196821 RepID=UPI0023E4467B|nr:hypothetical protein [Pseudomonas sp. D3]WET11971.1 hypothetical protein P3S72_07520 [Pseudomonas sp. D3]
MLLPLLALPMQFAGSMLGLGNMFGQNQPNANRDINININNDNHNVNAASSSAHSAHMSHGAARRASHIHY